MGNTDIRWNAQWDHDEDETACPARRPARTGLDRFLGDALIGAMVLIGFLFCVAAARAETTPAPARPGVSAGPNA